MHKLASDQVTAERRSEANDQVFRGKVGGQVGRHLALYVDHLRRGGVSKMRLIVAGALADRGHQVDLVVCEPGGNLNAQLPKNVRLVQLKRSSRIKARVLALIADPGSPASIAGLLVGPSGKSATLPYLPDLVRYLSLHRPDVFYVASAFMAAEAALAVRSVSGPTRLVTSEHIYFAPDHALVRGWNRWFIKPLLHRTYSRSDAVLGISNGVADEMARRSGFPRQRIQTIINPTVTPQLEREAQEPLDHPWFQPGQPAVVLGAGRLSRSKDFKTLVRAFAQVRKKRPLRLVILGDANAKDPGRTEKKTKKRKSELIQLAADLGVAKDVDLPGFASNPYQYMARAAVFVLSSNYEGLPNVLIEAMACGCPVVATDTPSGPAEILEEGRYGPLVPIGDVDAMARAIMEVLDRPPDPKRLRERAANFSVDRAADDYEKIVLSLT